MSAIPEDAPWQVQARCRYEGDPEDFFPVGTKAKARAAAKAAKLICRRCPVDKQCLAEALSRPAYNDYGIWGGLDQWERDAIRKHLGIKTVKRTTQ